MKNIKLIILKIQVFSCRIKKYQFFPRSRLAFGCQPAYMSYYVFFFLFALIHFLPFVPNEGVFSLIKMILTTQRHAKHLFAGQNTQQPPPASPHPKTPLFEILTKPLFYTNLLFSAKLVKLVASWQIKVAISIFEISSGLFPLPSFSNFSKTPDE